jgi:hypothetical protein
MSQDAPWRARGGEHCLRAERMRARQRTAPAVESEQGQSHLDPIAAGVQDRSLLHSPEPVTGAKRLHRECHPRALHREKE